MRRLVARLTDALRAKQPETPFRVATDRLNLRPFVSSDWEAVHAYRSDAETLRFQARTLPYDPAEVHGLVGYWQQTTLAAPRETCFFAIVRAEDDKLVGECSLVRSGDAHHLGFMLRRDAWGHGYGTEAAEAMLCVAFTHLDVLRVLAGCHPANDASSCVLTKIGMTRKEPRADFPGAPVGVMTNVFEATSDAWAGAPGRREGRD